MNTFGRGIGATPPTRRLDTVFATPSVRIISQPETLIIACSGDFQSYRGELQRPKSSYESPTAQNIPGSAEKPIPQLLIPGGFPIDADYSRIADLINLNPELINIAVYTHSDSCGIVGAVIDKIKSLGEPVALFDSEANAAIEAFIKLGLTKQDILSLVQKTDKFTPPEKVAKVLAKTIVANLAHDLTTRTPISPEGDLETGRSSFSNLRISARTRLENGLSEVVVPLTSLAETVERAPIKPPEVWARLAANGPSPSHPTGTGTLPISQGTVLQRSAPVHGRH